MRSLARRALGALLLFWLVVSLTFCLLRAAPGDAADLLIPPTASAVDAARMRTELGLDAPLAVQYARWIESLAKGDLGESVVSHRPVMRVLADAAPVSLLLGGSSLALTFVIGVAIGGVQAAKRGRTLDSALTVATTVLYSAPSFWLSLALVAVFTYGAARWGLPRALRLPAFGVRDPAGDLHGLQAFADVVRHAILPVTVLTVIGASGIARYARSAIADLLRMEYVRTARAKGAPPSAIYGRHVLANAAPPLLVLLALALPGVIAGSVFVESVFAWPGLGRAMLGAIALRDYPVVMGATIAYAALVIVANLLADVALPWLDPRRRS